jgi:hypothetical protein
MAHEEKTAMTAFSGSRRVLLRSGVAFGTALALPIVSEAAASQGLSPANEAMIRKYYGGWGSGDWTIVDTLLADDFTFTSAAPDDHISKSTFKKQCWDTQSALIEGFDLEAVLAGEHEAFVRYLCRTKNGKSFRNVEYFRLKGKQVQSIECYFGGPGYPSAADKRHT